MSAIDELAETGKSNHPVLVAFFEAQHINLHAGGAVVAPWDMLDGYELSEWADAAMQLSDVPAKRKRIKAQQQVFEKARREHPNYSKYHYRNRVN